MGQGGDLHVSQTDAEALDKAKIVYTSGGWSRLVKVEAVDMDSEMRNCPGYFWLFRSNEMTSKYSPSRRWHLLLIAGLLFVTVALAAGLWWNSPSTRYIYRGGSVNCNHWYRRDLLVRYTLIRYALERHKCAHGDYPETLDEWKNADPSIEGILGYPMRYAAGSPIIHIDVLKSDGRLLLVEEPGFLIEYGGVKTDRNGNVIPYKEGYGMFNDFKVGSYTDGDVRRSMLFQQQVSSSDY